MTVLERVIGAERAKVAQRLVRDEAVREELRRAAKHAAVLARGGRGWTGVGGLRDKGLQRHGVEVVRSLERVADIARGKRSRRRRNVFLVLGAAVGVSALAAAAKAAL